MAKLLATDLDGTLFFPKQLNRCISKKNVRFIRKWIDQGNRAVLITSRSFQFMDRLKKEIKRPFDCLPCSSSMVIVDDKIVKESYIPAETLAPLLEEICEKYHPLAYILTSVDYSLVIKQEKKVNFIFKNIYKLYHWLQFKYREPYIMDDAIFDQEVKKGKVMKVMIVFGLGKSKNSLSKGINKEIRDKYNSIEASWSDIVIELTPKGCSKGEGLEYYCNTLNIDSNDVYVVGDSGNDIAMFQKFNKNSYCMKHSFTSVRKYAKHTISRVHKLDKIVLKGEQK